MVMEICIIHILNITLTQMTGILIKSDIRGQRDRIHWTQSNKSELIEYLKIFLQLKQKCVRILSLGCTLACNITYNCLLDKWLWWEIVQLWHCQINNEQGDDTRSIGQMQYQDCENQAHPGARHYLKRTQRIYLILNSRVYIEIYANAAVLTDTKYINWFYAN